MSTKETNTMITTVDTITITDPDPCRATRCDMQDSPTSACRKRGCGFEWSKTARLDRKAREEKDRKVRENVCR
ncbi:hypothetical protein [Candidatus Deferrimicrobium sp.]|uniref:hypothetical protein n=1 Tax=Candidatus Deferrimicrobium sp. TaxID=3060586 RepID=UPI002ED98E5F